MDDLIINSTKKSFGVYCTNGLIELNGCSISNDPKAFFKPVFDWVEDYIQKPAKLTTVNCKIDYADTASLKHIFEILKLLVSLKSKEFDLIINWHIDYNDPELIEMAEILENRLKFKFAYI